MRTLGVWVQRANGAWEQVVWNVTYDEARTYARLIRGDLRRVYRDPPRVKIARRAPRPSPPS